MIQVCHSKPQKKEEFTPMFKSAMRKAKQMPPRHAKWHLIEAKEGEGVNYTPYYDNSLKTHSTMLQEEYQKAMDSGKLERAKMLIEIKDIFEYGAYCINKKRMQKK